MHKGSALAMKYVKKYEYFCQMDIRKFYPSIHCNTLKAIFRKKIKDDNVLWLLDSIVDSAGTETNAPIGNLSSQ